MECGIRQVSNCPATKARKAKRKTESSTWLYIIYKQTKKLPVRLRNELEESILLPLQDLSTPNQSWRGALNRWIRWNKQTTTDYLHCLVTFLNQLEPTRIWITSPRWIFNLKRFKKKKLISALGFNNANANTSERSLGEKDLTKKKDWRKRGERDKMSIDHRPPRHATCN